MDDPLDTSDMDTARWHMKRILVSWREAGGEPDHVVRFLEGFVACKVAAMLRELDEHRRAHQPQPAGHEP